MVRIDKAELDLIFGEESCGDTPEERARTSKRLFVRSQDQLAEYTPAATGRKLSAWEALQAFGLEVLAEVFEYGSAILPATPEEPAATLRRRREDLGLSQQSLARQARVELKDVKDAENEGTRTPIRVIEKIAQALNLNQHQLSFVPQAGGDISFARKLRSVGSCQTRSPSNLVLSLCEAAWVIERQYELVKWLGTLRPSFHFEPSPNYGGPDYPAWQHGYYLARETRKIMGIHEDNPIENLWELTEDRLGIPLVRLKLPRNLAGATVAGSGVRGIAVNVVGDNDNVWVRRVTMAHELGHLLWDPNRELENLRVDEYSDFEQAPWDDKKHFIEQRANAFAVEFLAPRKAAKAVFEKAGDYRLGLRSVMETFGLSFSSARYHIWNALERSVSLDELAVDNYFPTDDWKGRESFTLDYFKPESVPISRRGRFSSLVVQAEKKNLLTAETASTYLACTLDEYHTSGNGILDIFGLYPAS